MELSTRTPRKAPDSRVHPGHHCLRVRSTHDRCQWRGEEQATGGPDCLPRPEGERPPLRIRPIHLSALLSLFILLPSCGPSTSPLLIQLRTADTHAPIPNAAVEADSLALGPSLQFGDIIDDLAGRRAAFSDHATTDVSGIARLKRVPSRSVRLTFLDPARQVPFILFESAESPTDWRAMDTPSAASPTVEVRVLPPAPARP